MEVPTLLRDGPQCSSGRSMLVISYHSLEIDL